MLSQESIDRVNKLIENKVFNYNGHLLGDLSADIDFKLKFLGYMDMIYVGTPKPTMLIEVDAIKFKDGPSKLIFGTWSEKESKDPKDMARLVGKRLFSFKGNIEDYVSSILDVFDYNPDNEVIIYNFKISDDFKENVTEQKVPAIGIRTVLKDIVSVLKKREEGEFSLPYDLNGQESYQFINFPEFDVLVEIKYIGFDEIKSGADYLIDAGYSIGENQVVLNIFINPERLNNSIFPMVGQLNDDIAHELQHLRQETEGRMGDTPYKGSSVGYFLHPDEIEAQYSGFKRKSKITVVPMSDLIDDWFVNNQKRFKLSDNDVKKIKKSILSYPKSRKSFN